MRFWSLTIGYTRRQAAWTSKPAAQHSRSRRTSRLLSIRYATYLQTRTCACACVFIMHTISVQKWSTHMSMECIKYVSGHTHTFLHTRSEPGSALHSRGCIGQGGERQATSCQDHYRCKSTGHRAFYHTIVVYAAQLHSATRRDASMRHGPYPVARSICLRRLASASIWVSHRSVANRSRAASYQNMPWGIDRHFYRRAAWTCVYLPYSKIVTACVVMAYIDMCKPAVLEDSYGLYSYGLCRYVYTCRTRR